jgi:rare lipoprotein A (peptidoglycan hydrolase)
LTTRDLDRRPTHVAGDGELPSWWSALDRRRLAVALGSTFVAVPVVVLDNLPQHQGAQAEAEEVAVVAADPTTTTLPPPSSTTITVHSTTTTAAPTTTATTAAPPTTAAPTTATTAAPTTTATTAAPTTTTTAPPTTTTTAPPNAQSGKASWYRYNDGECAHRTLPRGTVVTITNVANGRTATCVVTDRGPYGGGRIIDLDDNTFAQLAPLSSGVVDVTISW